MRVALLLLLSLIAGQAVAAPVCPQQEEIPQINLTVDRPEPVYDYTKDIYDLISFGHGPEVFMIGNRRFFPLGLTQVTTRYTSNLETQVLPLENGQFCAYLKALNVKVIFNPTRVYVVSNLPKNSCIQREVLEHENRHVAADEFVLKSWIPILQRELDMVAVGTVVVSASSAKEATGYIANYLEPILQEKINRMLAARKSTQDRLDQGGEYQRITHACDGELKKYVPKDLWNRTFK